MVCAADIVPTYDRPFLHGESHFGRSSSFPSMRPFSRPYKSYPSISFLIASLTIPPQSLATGFNLTAITLATSPPYLAPT